MGMGELLGRRWILWEGHDELPENVFARARADHRPGAGDGEVSARVGIAATASYLPERWLSAAEIGEASGIPEPVLVEKFGLEGKHIAAPDEHVSDLAVAAAQRLLEEQALDPAEIDTVVYFGSTWKDYAVWQAAPWITHRLGCVERGRDRVRQRLLRDAGGAAGLPEPARRGAGRAERARGRRLARVVSPRLRERALAVHVQLRRRRGRRPPRSRRHGERAARLARDHRRLALAPRQGAGRGQRRLERGLPFPRRGRSRGDEGETRRGEPRQLRGGGRGRALALRADPRRRLVPVRDPHEAVDARGARGEARRRRSRAPRTSTTRVT